MRIQKILIVLFLLFSLMSYAQPDMLITKSEPKLKIDTTRIKDLSNQLSVWLYSINKLYSIKLKNENMKEELQVSPNEQANIGFGFNYKWMGLGIAFKPPFAKNDDDIYGKTSRFDMQLNIFSRSFGLDFSAQYYKGYHISNPKKFMDWNDGDPYPQLNNLQTGSLELSGYFFTNHRKFSYRAAFVRNDIQIKSAGSPIFGAYMRLDFAVSPENGFIPEGMPINLKDTFDIYAFRAGNYGTSFGYTYTLVLWKNLFINLSLVPGFGIKTLTAYTAKEGEVTPKIGLSGRIVVRSALGYEHKHFYVGLSHISITNGFKYQNLNVSTTTTKIRFFVGKRFNVRKKK